MKKSWSVIRKTAIAIVGVLILVLGIVLIPLPGPGLVVCFLGLLVLSVEFEWAKKHRDNAKSHLNKILESSKNKTR